MKNSIKLCTFFLVVSALVGCASTQKNAELNIKPRPAKISHSDESAAGYYQLGQHYQNTQRSELALQAYQEASRLDSNDVKPQLAMAVLNAKNGNYSASILQLKYLVEKFPADASLYNNLGYTYYLSGDYKSAAAALGQAIVIDHKHVLALNNMGATLNKLGKNELAIKYIAQAQAIKSERIELANTNNSLQTNQQAVSYHSNADALDVAQNNDVEAKASSNNSQSEIQQVSAGIYELVNVTMAAETAVDKKLAANPVLSEVQVLVQPGCISFKVHPLVNKLFKENTAVIADNSDLRIKSFNLEIMNGNGIKGFAKKTAETLVGLGLSQPVQFSNKKHYNQTNTVLEYKAGYYKEAIQLAQTLEQMPMLVETNVTSRDADIRLVVGKDVVNSHYKNLLYI